MSGKETKQKYPVVGASGKATPLNHFRLAGVRLSQWRVCLPTSHRDTSHHKKL